MIIPLKLLENLQTNPHFSDTQDAKWYQNNGPSYAQPGDAGMDLRACTLKAITLQPTESVLIPTGIAIHIGGRQGMYKTAGVIIPKSGLGANQGIILGNGTGLIDQDYQGQIMVSIYNRSPNPYLIQPAQKLCQIVFIPVINAQFKLVDDFDHLTERHTGGFGSTGIN